MPLLALPTVLAVLALPAALPALAGFQGAPTVHLLRTPDSGIQPQAVAAPNGALHLLYFKGDPKAGDLYYTSRPSADAPFTPIRVNSQPGSAVATGNIRGGQLAIDASGHPHILWNGSSTATPKGPKNPAQPADSPFNGMPLLYTRLAGTGAEAAFEPQRNLMARSTALDGGGSIAIDARGDILIAWHALPLDVPASESNRRVFLACSTDHGATFAPETAISPDGLGACALLALKAYAGPDGSLNILFRSATRSVHRDEVLLRSTDLSTFSSTPIHPWELNACPMTTAVFADGPDHALLMAWQTGDNVYLASRTDKGLSSPTPAPGDAKARKYPTIAVNFRNEILLAWTEGMAWGQGGSLRWQVYTPALKPIPLATGTAPGVPAWSLISAAANPDGSFTIVY